MPSLCRLPLATTLILIHLIVVGLQLVLSQSPNISTSNQSTKVSSYRSMISTLKELLRDESFEDVAPYEKTEVECSILVNNITGVRENTQTFSLDVYLNTYWTDYRLNNTNFTDDVIIPDKYFRKLWLPDIGFSNAKGGAIHTVTEQNVGVILGTGGRLHMTSRVAIELSCAMEFKFYPLDTQMCELQLQSWRYDEEELDIAWSSDLPYAIAAGASVGLPQYRLSIHTSSELYDLLSDKGKQYQRQDGCVEVYETAGYGHGSYACLELKFIFQRRLGFYALDLYVPSALIVLVSFMALFIDYNILPARITTGSLSVTAMTNILRSFKRQTPPVSYTKAADVWIWTCQIFVFAVFLELGFVNVFNRKYKSFKKSEGNGRKCGFLFQSRPAKSIDKVSRIFFPVSYLFFNLVYWSYYYSASMYNHDLVYIIEDRLIQEHQAIL